MRIRIATSMIARCLAIRKLQNLRKSNEKRVVVKFLFLYVTSKVTC